MSNEITKKDLEQVVGGLKEHVDKRFEGFDKRFEGFDKRFDEIDKRFDDQDEILTALKDTIDDHTNRLERIENLLWQGQRIDKLEERLIKIAQKSGYPDLAVPIEKPF